MTSENIATIKDLPPAAIEQTILFLFATLSLVLRMLWTQRHHPSRRNHFARHSPIAVGHRDGRSVGQIQRRLGQERR